MTSILTPNRRRAAAAAALALTATLGLAACGNSNGADTSASTSPTTESSQASPSSQAADSHNESDVAFASQMIPHHEQALAMVEMTQGHHLDPAVQKLADDIRAAQTPEIKTMTGWLTSWGAPVPTTTATPGMGSMNGMSGTSDMPGMSHSSSPSAASSSMAGMMSDADMMKLQHASASEFQRMWLQMMIRHHESAVAMAKTEEGGGAYGPAVELAKRIVASQSQEIETMKGLLAS